MQALAHETHGHQAGDQLLRNVAERLRNGVSDADVVARLGGDEFVVVLTDIQTPDDAAMVADKLLDSMHGVFTVDHLPLTI